MVGLTLFMVRTNWTISRAEGTILVTINLVDGILILQVNDTGYACLCIPNRQGNHVAYSLILNPPSANIG